MLARYCPLHRPSCRLAGIVAIVLLVSSACGGNEDLPAPPPASEPVPPPPIAGDTPPPVPVLEMLPAAGDEDVALAALGAIPVWDTVTDRGRYLGRRRLQGVVYGRLGGSIDGYRWLIDETEGAGALAIRMAVDERIALREGQRLVSWGAWWVDDQQRWYWKAERLAGLAPPASDTAAGTESTPGLAIVSIPQPPEGAEPVSQRTTPGDILFQICAVPGSPTDGWEIADRSGDAPVALLRLPGERAAYGGQDYRTSDEHWKLEPRVTYTVRVRRFRAARSGELVLMRAVDAPRRIASGVEAPVPP